MERHGLDDVEQLTAEGEVMTVEERAEFLLIIDKLAFLEAMSARIRPQGSQRFRNPRCGPCGREHSEHCAVPAS